MKIGKILLHRHMKIMLYYNKLKSYNVGGNGTASNLGGLAFVEQDNDDILIECFCIL